MNIKNYVHFVCHGQSGHTVLAQIIDAHPNAMIGEEVGAAYKILRGKWDLNKTFNQIYTSSEASARKSQTQPPHKRRFGSWRPNLGRFSKTQGPTDDIQVMGDKLGWHDIELQALQDKLGVPLKVIHAVRNPFDVIASWYTGGRHYEEFRRDPNGLNKLIDRYIGIVDPLSRNCYESGWPRDSVLVVKNEDLRHHPDMMIRTIFDYLELEADDKWVRRVASHVDPKVSDKKRLINWPDEVHERVHTDLIARYHFLHGYF